MDIFIHDTLRGKKTRFEPLVPDQVSIYVCGPTVYNLVHIGNGRPAVVFDVLVRLLKLEYGTIKHAANITDVDDKINAIALANGEPIQALADRYVAAYAQDIAALGVMKPTVEPRATHHIPEIVEMIGTLIERGHAYESQGHVLFDVSSDPNYGTLSKRSLKDMLDGARVEIAPYKRDPKDFVLWKPSTPELPGWDSPWGRGRPGWHIECSAMIHKHLGPTIDIHGGGNDLTFPHHENELAQGTCIADDQAYVRFWMHNGMLNMGTEKMSKSLGNIVTIRDLLQNHSGEVLRYALLSGHYRQSLVWDDALIEQAKASLDRLYQALLDVPQTGDETADVYRNAAVDAFPPTVLGALCDDLNTPQALAAMHGLVGEIHKTDDADEARALRDQLLAGGWLLGLLNIPVGDYFKKGTDVDAATIERMIDERNAARGDKNFAKADEIRDALLGMGIELEDTREGTRWKAV
ncbi:MAG: cysteine--tRNA ligase [Gammaproteobacteria bacterium]|nr:cysteine--tRNA ligase [Gammaproteobacteria bacterium]